MPVELPNLLSMGGITRPLATGCRLHTRSDGPATYQLLDADEVLDLLPMGRCGPSPSPLVGEGVGGEGSRAIVDTFTDAC